MAKKKKPSIVAESNRREVQRQQQAAQKARQARNRRTIIAVALAMAVVIVVVFTIVILQNMNRGGSTVPPSATADHLGLSVNPQAASAKHKVALYLDYQCSACKQFEDAYGAQLVSAATAGQISLEYRSVVLLDRGSNDSSLRASVAAACADTVGAYSAYHDQVMANQPTQEGTGFTTTQLRTDFAKGAGITDAAKLTAFQKCYDNRETQQFVQQVSEAAQKAGVNATPQVDIDGTRATNAGTALTNLLASLQTTATATPQPATATPVPGTPAPVTPVPATPAAKASPTP